MKSSFGSSLALRATLVLVVAIGTVGCQSGFKFRNPFSKAPEASRANPPKELDDLDDLTPPPENYTTSDASDAPKKSESLAQKGSYEAEDSRDKSVAAEPASETLVASKEIPILGAKPVEPESAPITP
ncbi:MAG: hypothetical protein IJM30_02985, partial [Thermoguttaceae bacterium]|nr:hypothetical protein [Thermoguttaceae bacterium]